MIPERIPVLLEEPLMSDENYAADTHNRADPTIHARSSRREYFARSAALPAGNHWTTETPPAWIPPEAARAAREST